jgi:CRISPR-associated protein Cas1
LWYKQLGRRLGSGFSFTRRTAPDAHDPVNVLLNIAHTLLYRHMILAARAAGLSPALGIFHVSDGRFASLAGDLQEPFRHLMERAVIEATCRLRPQHFRTVLDGPFALTLEWQAARQFQAILQRLLRTQVVARGQTEPRSYREQFLVQARSLRRHLLNSTQPFEAFVHP